MVGIVNRFSALVLCFSVVGCGNQQDASSPKQDASGPKFMSDVAPVASAKVQQIDNPDTIPLTVLAAGWGGGGHGGPLGLSAPAIGVANCEKTAEEMLVVADNSRPGWYDSISVSCIPQSGGHAVARFKCKKANNGQYGCTPEPL